MRERNIGFLVWLDKADKELLERSAKKCGLTKQAYVRMLLHNIAPREQPPADFYKVLKALNQINNNLNQIALKANALNFINVEDYRRNVSDLQKVTAELVRKAYN